MQTYKEEIEALLEQNLPWGQISGKTILISGATGMIGKCIIDILMQCNSDGVLDKPVSIIALSRNEENAGKRLFEHWNKDTFQYISCAINQSIPECGQADYIIHAASNTHPL